MINLTIYFINKNHDVCYIEKCALHEGFWPPNKYYLIKIWFNITIQDTIWALMHTSNCNVPFTLVKEIILPLQEPKSVCCLVTQNHGVDYGIHLV